MTTMSRGMIALLLLCFAAVTLTSPDAAAAPTARVDGYYQKAPYRSAKVYLEVTTAEGKPVPNLASEAATVTCRGKPVKHQFQTFVQSQEGLALVVAIDSSGSMRGRPIKLAVKAALDFIGALGSQDKVAVIRFDSQVTVVSGFDDSPLERGNKLNRLASMAGGNTLLYDAVEKAVQLLRSPSMPHRRAVVLLTDGKDDGSARKLEETIDIAKGAKVPVFAIGYGWGRKVDFSDLRRLGSLTQGYYLDAPDPKVLGTVYKEIAYRLRNLYVLTLDTTTLPADGHSHPVTIALKTTSGPSSTMVSVRSPMPSKPVVVEDGDKPKKKAKPIYTEIWFLGAVGGGVILILVILLVLRSKKKKAQAAAAAAAAKRAAEEKARREAAEAGAKRDAAERQRQQLEQAKKTAAAEARAQAEAEAQQAAGPRTLAALLVMDGDMRGQRFDIYGDIAKLGRGQSCEVIITDDTVSSDHATFRLKGDVWRIEDHSTYGTKVNGEKVSSSDIYDGDALKFGNVNCKFLDLRRSGGGAPA